MFLVGSIARIKILRDGVVIERPVFGKSYWSFSEVKLRLGGRTLDYGGMFGGSIIPLKWRQCAQTITSLKTGIILIKEKPMSRALPLLYIFFVPTVMFIAAIIARRFHLLIPPLAWALAWATGITFSFIAYTNSSPVPRYGWALAIPVHCHVPSIKRKLTPVFGLGWREALPYP